MPYMVKENLWCFSTGYSKVSTELCTSFCVLNIGHLIPKTLSQRWKCTYKDNFSPVCLSGYLRAQNPAATWDVRVSSCFRFRFKAWWEGIYPCAGLSQGVLRHTKQSDSRVTRVVVPAATQGAIVNSQPIQLKFPELYRFVFFCWTFWEQSHSPYTWSICSALKSEGKSLLHLGSSLGEHWLTLGGRGRCCDLGVQ